MKRTRFEILCIEETALRSIPECLLLVAFGEARNND